MGKFVEKIKGLFADLRVNLCLSLARVWVVITMAHFGHMALDYEEVKLTNSGCSSAVRGSYVVLCKWCKTSAK